MKPFIPNVLHAARFRPIAEYPKSVVLCCDKIRAEINKEVGRIIVLQIGKKPDLKGGSVCHYCAAEHLPGPGLWVYWHPNTMPDYECVEVFNVDVDEAPLTKEEYERICLANHDTATAARRGSN